MPEIWKTFYKGYKINKLGIIKSIDRNIKEKSGKQQFRKGKIIKTFITNSGYLSVSITNKHKKFYIHRLLAEKFIRKLKNKEEINHKDGNKLNNNLFNLEIVTRSENLIHSHRILGNKVWNIKLNKNKANKIRKKYKKGNIFQHELAKEYKVSTMTINRIINNIQYEYR